jgi:hypothetical protein
MKKEVPWKRLYFIVVILLIIQIALYYIISKTFS